MRRKLMKNKKIMRIDEKQKKLLLNLFNAGRTFTESYRESGIKYIHIGDMENLLDLLDDMKEGLGISPTISENKDNNGNYYPNHWSDHVWDDDPKSWRKHHDSE